MSMGNGDDAFVKKAFKDAVMRVAEASAAQESFERRFDTVLKRYIDELGAKDTDLFAARNCDESGKRAVALLSEMFFLAGFREGVLYKTRKKQ